MAPWSGSPGSQTYSRTDGTRSGSTVWQDANAASVDIVADGHDTHDQDIADAVNVCLKKDGGNTATGDIPLGGHKVTGMGDGVANTDAVTVSQLNGIASGNVPAGTAMLFVQTAAPAGWTKSTTHNDKTLRVVSGSASSGGSTAFTSIFASRTVAQANLPNINLSAASLIATVTDPGHSHTYTKASLNQAITSGGNSNKAGNTSGDTTGTNTTGITVAMSGNVPLGGSGTAMDFAVQYVDVIIATKN